MTPIYEKLLEVIMNKQITEYIENNKLLTEHQAGFRRHNSCESALQSVLVKWKEALNKKQIVGVVFLDFKRAFETVNRNLLLLKLKNFGFGQKVLNLLRDYLENRLQVVKFNDTESSPQICNHGVPQGTVMGPNLFTLYINDIVQYVDKCSIQLFADDTLLYYAANSVTEVISVINKELHIIQGWLGSNSLVVNVQKTKFMLIRSRYNFSDINNHNGVYIYDTKLEQVRECKYLGIMIDDNLTFSTHATYISSKIAKKVNIISRLRNTLSGYSKLLIYKTIVNPHFNYCASVLFLFNNKQIYNIQKKQNQAMRAILNCSRYTSVRNMLEKTELLSVRQMVYLNSMVVIYKIKNRLLPQHLAEHLMYVDDIHQHETRSRGDFYVSTVTTGYSQNNLFHKGLVEFNRLPREVKNSQTLVLFKRNCRRYCIESIAL